MLIIPNHSIIFNIHSHYSHFLFLFYSHTPTPQKLVIPSSLVPIPDFKTYQLLAITWMAPTSPPLIFPDSVKAPKRPYLMVKLHINKARTLTNSPICSIFWCFLSVQPRIFCMVWQLLRSSLIPSPVHMKHPMVPMECGNFLHPPWFRLRGV